jgi:uncharacterized membrane protein
MAIANASVFAFSALLDSMTPPTQRWIAVESCILRCCFFAAQLFDVKHVTPHDRLDQTSAINPADTACYDVYIPTAVTLFPRE